MEYDSQTDPQNSRAMVQKAIDEETFVLLGTVYSSSTVVNMLVAQQNGVPQITGSESPTITAKGNPYIFRTAFGAQKGLPKLGSYIKNDLGASKVAVIWANTEFGKGGHDAFLSVAEAQGIEIVANIPTEQAQVDFAADVAKLKSSGAEAVFSYMTEEESARFLIEAAKQDLGLPIVGDTVVASQKVIDLAGEAANGVASHVGLTAEAPIPGDSGDGCEVPGEIRLRRGPQRDQGLHRRVHDQICHGKGRVFRPSGLCRHIARPVPERIGISRCSDGCLLGRHGVRCRARASLSKWSTVSRKSPRPCRPTDLTDQKGGAGHLRRPSFIHHPETSSEGVSAWLNFFKS